MRRRRAEPRTCGGGIDEGCRGEVARDSWEEGKLERSKVCGMARRTGKGPLGGASVLHRSRSANLETRKLGTKVDGSHRIRALLNFSLDGSLQVVVATTEAVRECSKPTRLRQRRGKDTGDCRRERRRTKEQKSRTRRTGEVATPRSLVVGHPYLESHEIEFGVRVGEEEAEESRMRR
jgi:hypothetical protein